ncbi:MAG: putative toxin-antitoxin system toxin component, PIN family [Candidatus Margulisbacteria bacterium]|nr:putative toxin-antitoxin system toxin component, PIN family [Candidatus Margulisiibacteriota bacterium]
MSQDSSVSESFYLALKISTVLMSFETFSEFVEVSTRKKIEKYLCLDYRDEFTKELASSKKIEHIPVNITITDCPDPKDNKFLEVAVYGKADYIISGDSDLLNMNPYRGIKIVKPKIFLVMYS